MCSIEKVYDWKRYWTLYENVTDFSYEYSYNFEDTNFTLENLRKEKCLILLGDAALGKSTCLKQEESSLKKINIPCKLIDFKNTSGEKWLTDKFMEVQELTSKNKTVYLLLDSFDEGLYHFCNLVNILIEKLRRFDLSKIHIRIACRTVVFPEILINELKALKFKAQNKFSSAYAENEATFNNINFTQQNTPEEKSPEVKVYKLQPLSKTDINVVLEDKNISSDEFYSKIPFSDELLTPITALYVINEYPNILNLSLYEVYQKMCQKLSSKCNLSNNKISLVIGERIKIASIIALLMSFSNKNSISYNTEIVDFDDQTVLYLQKYFSGEGNILDILRLSLPSGNIEEVLNTGLFTRKNDNICFIQKTYQEFLASEFIISNNLYQKFRNLMLDEYDKVLPFFANTASWVAEKNDSVFSEILEKDPETLITSITNFSSNEKNKKLLSKFFETVNAGFDGNFSIQAFLKKINLEKNDISNIVEPYLNSDDSSLVYYAIAFLSKNKIIDFQDRIFEIAISKSYNTSCRSQALFFIQNNCPEKLADVQNHLTSFINEDIEESSHFAYTLINVLLPDNLSLENLNLLLNQNLESNFYYHVEAKFIAQNEDILKIFILKLLEFFSQENATELHSYSKLLKSLIEKLSFENSPEFYCKVLNQSIDNCFLRDVACLFSEKISKLNIKKKHEIFSHYFSMTLQDNSNKLFAGLYRVFFNKRDSLFLIKEYLKTESKTVKNFIKELFLCTSIISPLVTLSYNVRTWFKHCISAIQKREITYHEYTLQDLVDKIKYYCQKAKKLYFIMIGRTYIKFAKQHIKNFYKNPSTTSWNNTIYCLSLVDKEHHTSLIPTEISHINGFNKLNKKEQNSLIDIAYYYLKNYEFTIENKNHRLLNNSFNPYADLLCVPAIFLLYKHDDEKINELIDEKKLIENCLAFIINYPIEASFEYYNQQLENIMNFLFEKSPQIFLNELSYIIDVKMQAPSDNIYYILDTFSNTNNSILEQMLVEKIKIILQLEIDEIKTSLFKHIMDFLVLRQNTDAKNILEKILKNETISSKIKAQAANYLSNYAEDNLIKFENLLETNQEFAEEYFETLARSSFKSNLMHSNNITPQFNEIELAKLYIILERHYPLSEDTYANGVVTLRDEISSLRRHLLNYVINEGFIDFFAYIKENSKIEISKFTLDRAKRMQTQKKYQFLSVGNLVNLVLNEKRRIILNEKHFFELVIETLDEIRVDVRKDRKYLRVWNEDRNICYPKNENALSDELKRELCSKLKNVIVNREVEINPKVAGNGSQSSDLVLEYISIQGDKFSVIIEVKGCWNKHLRSSIKTQLLDAYLCDDNCYKYGIYLIGWYCCNKWDTQNKTKRMNCISSQDKFSQDDINETIKYFDDQAQFLSNEYKKIKTIVIDYSIPD